MREDDEQRREREEEQRRAREAERIREAEEEAGEGVDADLAGDPDVKWPGGGSERGQ